MLAEAINVIRLLWTGEEVTYEGSFFQTRKARLYTRPERPIPLYVSSRVPNSAWFAGQHGDGLLTVGGDSDDVYHAMLANFEKGARQVGRDPARMARLIELTVAYTDDEQAVIEVMKQYWAGTFVPALFNQKIYTPAMSAKNGKVVGADTIKQKMCLSADPEIHVKFALRYLDLGFTTLFFHCPGPDQRAFLEAYGRDVLPRIREAAQGRAQSRQQRAHGQAGQEPDAQAQRREPAGSRG